MTIKAKLGDIIFELETDADVRTFLAAAKNGGLSGHIESAPAAPPAPVSSGLTSRQKLEQVYAKANTELQRKFFALLSAAPDGLNDKQLRDGGLNTNFVLAGVIGAISKNATAHGLAFAYVLTKVRLRGRREVKYHYKLTPDMLEVVLARS